jgi:hypothetical protein
MKKTIIYIILTFLLLSSCSKKIDIKPLDKKFYIDKDDNDTINKAVEVTIQQNPIVGFFNKKENTGDRDYYKVSFALRNTSYKIVQTGVPGIDSKLEIYLPNGDILFKIDRNGIGEAEVLSEYYPSTDYIILMTEAKTSYNEKVPYIINFIPKNESGVNEIEPNNNEENAIEISIGDEKKGLLSPANDVDYYKIKYNDGEANNFLVKIETLSNLDINFTLINKESNLIKYVNNFGWGSKEFYSFLSKKKGDYYIKVSGNTNLNDRKDPLYYITIEKLPDDRDGATLYYEEEFNDLKDMATELIDNAEITGIFFPEKDEDWYKFELYKNPISVDLSLSSIRGIDPIIEIYNSDAKLINTINSGKIDSGENASLKNLSKGRYFIRLYSEKKSMQEYKLFFNIRYN